MKKMLLAVLLSQVIVMTPAHGLVGGHWAHCPYTVSPHTIPQLPVPVVAQKSTQWLNDMVFGMAIAGFGVAGIWYLLSCTPSWRLSSAQNTYNSFDQDLARFVDYAAQHAGTNLEAVVVRFYPCSIYPLVKMFNALCKASQSAQSAIRSLDTAMWWSHEETFVHTCTQLKNLLSARFALLGNAMSSLRGQSSWCQQYALYLKCNGNGVVTHIHESSSSQAYIYQKEQQAPAHQPGTQPSVATYPAQLPSDFVVFDNNVGCWQINDKYIG